MPGAWSNKGADIALDAAFGRATQTARTVYLQACTADPGAAGVPGDSEYSATGYARPTFTPATPVTAGSGRKTGNTNAVTVGPITGANGTTAITHVALVSSSSGTTGDLIYRWQLTTSRTPAAGDSLTIAIDGVNATVQVTPLS